MLRSRRKNALLFMLVHSFELVVEYCAFLFEEHWLLLQMDSPVIAGLCNSSHRTGAYRHDQNGNCMHEFVNMAFWPH